MQLNLGTKIRELCRRDGCTQENLAEFLGVSAQAVSRWESGGSYPDMEMIPSIANFFHISIDELFGYNDNREKRIEEIVTYARQKILGMGGYYSDGPQDDLLKCVEILRDAADEFPNESKILFVLGAALDQCSWYDFDENDHKNDCIEFNSKKFYMQESARVYEKLLKVDAEQYEREWAVRKLVQLYCQLGENDKAKNLANKQNSIILSREVLMPYATVGVEKEKYQGERITNLLLSLSHSILNSVSRKPSLFNEKYGIEIIISVINVYETLFIDGNCGFYHNDISQLYYSIARHKAMNGSDLSKALKYFDKAFEHSKAFERIVNEGGDYTAPLVSGMGPIKKGELGPTSKDYWTNMTRGLPENICTELRKNPKYAVCFE